MVTWQDSLGTSDERTDSQHKVLIEQFNQLEEIMNNSSTGTFRQAAGEVLDFLQFYASWHFEEEEKLILETDSEQIEINSFADLQRIVEERGQKGLQLQRFKGLGEMMPQQLWDTTMNPETRTLKKVSIEDAILADQLFDILMGDKVEPRRDFIESNAIYATNIDT